MMKRFLVSVLVLSFVLSAGMAAARDTVAIVGSSTVYPFATVVAEQFGKTSKFNTPKIESTGSGGGLKLFCAGVGVEHPDITNASRRIKVSECVMCKKNGVEDIIEVKIGYRGTGWACDGEGDIRDGHFDDSILRLTPTKNNDMVRSRSTGDIRHIQYVRVVCQAELNPID